MFEIKVAQKSDAATLADISEKTFVETFARNNDPKNIEDYVSKNFGTEKQLKEICDPNRMISIAWKGAQAVGFYHLYKGPADPSVKGVLPIELLRLYVFSEWHGQGLAHLLINKCIAEATATGYKTLWLGVWEKNLRARAFYKKIGFVERGNHIFQLGNEAQTDFVMEKSLITHV